MMPIPGANRGKLPVVYRVAIGDAPEGAGKGPRRLDYFKIKRRSPETRSVWVTDEEAQNKLINGFDDPFGNHIAGLGPKPQRVPILLFSDKLEDMLVSGLSWYGKRGRYCWATEFQGLDWDDENAPAHCRLAHYGKPPGMDDAAFTALTSYHRGKQHICKPATCPNYAPDKGTKFSGYACNRFLFFRFILPFAPSFPGVAEFRTKGKASCVALENTIRGFQSELADHPAGVLLHLAMQPYQTQYEGGTTTQWEVRLEAPTDMVSFRRDAARALEARISQASQLAHIAEEFKALPAWTEETPEQIHEYTREFLPAQEDLPPVDQSARFYGLADSLGWLPGQRAAILAKHDGDFEAAADEAQEEFDRHTEEGAAPVEVAEPEPAEAPPEKTEAEETRDDQGLSPDDYQEPESAEPVKLPTCPKCGQPFIHVEGTGRYTGKTWWDCSGKARGECDGQCNEDAYARRLAALQNPGLPGMGGEE